MPDGNGHWRWDEKKGDLIGDWRRVRCAQRVYVASRRASRRKTTLGKLRCRLARYGRGGLQIGASVGGSAVRALVARQIGE